MYKYMILTQWVEEIILWLYVWAEKLHSVLIFNHLWKFLHNKTNLKTFPVDEV